MMLRAVKKPLIWLGAIICLTTVGVAQPRWVPAERSVVVEDFESYRDGGLPERWTFISRRDGELALQEVMNDKERFYVVNERGNTFLRGYTEGEAQRISLLVDEDSFDWSFGSYPSLRWRWRALQLPQNANEREKNDTGAALYVTFDTDWLGRPRSIKYTYSSTLPVGTVVSFGRLKVIVAASARDGIGDWVTVERHVVEDYRRVFGKEPPESPLSITLWSDSDDTGGVAEVDFDDIVLIR